MREFETYIPEKDCRPKFDILAPETQWHGGQFYLVRWLLSLTTVGKLWYRMVFNLLRFTLLLASALVIDFAILLLSALLGILGSSLKKAMEQTLILVRQALLMILSIVVKLLVFSGYLLVVLVFYLKFSVIKDFILSIFK